MIHIDEKRKKMRLSQEDVANMVGISRQYYNYIENRKRIPSVKLAKEIAYVLDIQWTIFFTNKVNVQATLGREGV